MELRHLRYFLAVAEERNFTRAAARIGIGQPPLSHQIQDLEREIGAPLFRRLPHGAELTEAGQAFLPCARNAVRLAEQAKRTAMRASRGETGHIRIGFTGASAFNPVVPEVIRAFRRAYPLVEIDLEERNTELLVEGVLNDDLDGAFIRPCPKNPAPLRLHHLADEDMVMAMPSGHALAHAPCRPLRDMAEEPFILFPRDLCLGLYEEVLQRCREAGFEPRPGQTAPQLASAVNLVAAEMGVSLVPRSFTHLRVPGVSYVDIAPPAPTARLAFAHLRDSRAVTLRNFLGMVTRHIRLQETTAKSA